MNTTRGCFLSQASMLPSISMKWSQNTEHHCNVIGILWYLLSHVGMRNIGCFKGQQLTWVTVIQFHLNHSSNTRYLYFQLLPASPVGWKGRGLTGGGRAVGSGGRAVGDGERSVALGSEDEANDESRISGLYHRFY